MNVFEYRDYKQLVNDLIEIRQKISGRGERKKISEFIGCQVSHTTSVLSGESHFSLEQADGLARYLGFDYSEKDFFFTLIQLNRAGTESLKEFFEKKLWELQRKFSQVTKGKPLQGELPAAEKEIFFSSWINSAVLALINIKKFQTREALAKKLNLSLERIDKVLSFLIQNKLCKKDNLRYYAGDTLIHLPHDSELIQRHHLNWRLKSLHDLEEINSDDFRYSGVITISEKDYPKIREALSKAIAKAIEIAGPSASETTAIICLDYFKLR